MKNLGLVILIFILVPTVGCSDKSIEDAVELIDKDSTPPVITLNGAGTITLLQGSDYVEAGASATDDVDGNVTVTTSGAVDINTPYTYTIIYTATDSANNTSTTVRTVVIELNATYTLDPTSGVVALTVNFTASQASNITSYEWDFGDGTTASGATNSHTYNQTGTYTTSLTVTGSTGDRATTNQDLVVLTSPDGNTIIVPDNVYFFDDFEYNVSRDSVDSAANQTAFQNAGWQWAKAINTTGSHISVPKLIFIYNLEMSPVQRKPSLAMYGTSTGLKLHLDTSGPQGTYEACIKPMGGNFIKVAEWISGENGFSWNVAAPGGHRQFRMPTSVPGANNNEFYDSWVYLDDFAIATSEDALPQYQH